jgi:hypothetical protein
MRRMEYYEPLKSLYLCEKMAENGGLGGLFFRHPFPNPPSGRL